MGLPGTRSTIETFVNESSFFWRHDTSTPVNKQGVKLYKALLLGTSGRSLADQFSEDQICSGQGFDLIIRAIPHHFRSYLEAEPEVQAEIALYQSMRSLKGFFVEYTSRTSNELREMESGFKVLLPPKLNSFNIKRQAKLTHDQAKHLHFYIPTTRGLEANKTVDALNRLDLTDAHVEQNTHRQQSWSTMPIVVMRIPTAMRRRIRWKLKLPRQTSRTTTTTTKHRTQRDQLDCVLERIDDDGYPLVDENGSTLVIIQHPAYHRRPQWVCLQ